MANSTIRQEFDIIESTLLNTAAQLDGLAFALTNPTAVPATNVPEALRERARVLRKLAMRISVRDVSPTLAAVRTLIENGDYDPTWPTGHEED